MGQARKPMISVPNHMLGQWNSDFLEAYPGARLLVADEENFSPQRRQEFMGLIANSDYDAVIITHSAFKLMGMAHASEAAFLKEELAKYDRVLDALPKSDRRGRRDIEAMREKMRDKLAALANMKRDKGLVWDDLGVDMLVVDEAHEYRKLSFATTRTRTKGIDPQGSQAAWDLYMKLRGIHARTPGRNILFLSGTPVVNTMAEVYSVQRMLQPQALAAAGLESFDDWANSFAGDKITFEKTAGKGSRRRCASGGG